MSNTVSLNATSAGVQHALASAAVTDNGGSVFPSIAWSSSDPTVATVTVEGLVVGVADPSGPSTRQCDIIATCTVNGVESTGSGQVTVITTVVSDNVVVTVDFGPAQP